MITVLYGWYSAVGSVTSEVLSRMMCTKIKIASIHSQKILLGDRALPTQGFRTERKVVALGVRGSLRQPCAPPRVILLVLPPDFEFWVEPFVLNFPAIATLRD